MTVWLFAGGLAILASGPFVAVVIGCRAFDSRSEELEAEPLTCTDDTIMIKRIIVHDSRKC
jgi:hypothetical protein